MKNFKLLHAFSGYLLLLVVFVFSQSGKKVAGGKTQNDSQYRVAIELILDDASQMESLLGKLGQLALDCYQWRNHLVLFGDAADTVGINSLVRHSGIDVAAKCYKSPMYVFDRAEHCADSSVSKPWKDYLLTANLVEDTALQQEYMHCHAVQFEEWPEVAKGFCYAGFQQLLVFRHERQLMLVISIPADKTLDELDPKTVENNPRMVEWNSRMGGYQDGIEGTEEGETWVFLHKVE